MADRFWQEEGPRADISLLPVMRRSLIKSEIIRKKDDIDRIFKEGKSVSAFGMRLIFLDNNLGFDRLLVVPARHFGTSVERNKARRRAKEIFRNHPKRHPFGSEYDSSKDIALIMYPGKVSSFSVLESGFSDLLDRYCWK